MGCITDSGGDGGLEERLLSEHGAAGRPQAGY